MKKLITILTILYFYSNVTAQAPQKMSYQAVIRNSNNVLVSNTTVGMRISILQGSTTGTAVFVETQTPSTNLNGLVSIQIGDGTLVSGSFGSINWSNNSYFVKTETDPTGGNNYSIVGTSQLLSIPYALFSETSQKTLQRLNNNELTSFLKDSVNIPKGGILIGNGSGIKADTNDFYWDNEYNQLLIGGSQKGKLTEGYSSGLQLIQNPSVWPQMTIYSTSLTSNSIPRYRGANIKGSLTNFENTIRSTVLLRLAGTGSVDNPDVLRAGCQIEFSSAKDWNANSSPANITLETVPINNIDYKNYATFTYNGSFQLGFNHPNSLHSAIDSKTKLLVLAEDSSNQKYSLEISKSDISKNIFSVRNDGEIKINGNLDISGTTTLENTQIKSANWIYFGDSTTNGTWRLGVQNGNFIHQILLNGIWETKQTIQP